MALSLLMAGVISAQTTTKSYKDPDQPTETRVKDLIGRMTLEEKVGQMCQYVAPDFIRESMKADIGENDDAHGFYKDLSINELLGLTEKGLVGSYLHVFTAEESNRLQRLAMKSRLQIPLLIGIDAVHGDGMVSGATVYPSPISLASSFDTLMVEHINLQTASEVRARGSQWAFAPNIDVARDPRWGRIGETFGEDPYLVTKMGVAAIRGLQSGNVIACAKHMIAGSEPFSGTNASPMDVSDRQLREIFLPPYKAAVNEGVATVMAAHNELNGIPCHENKALLQGILRKEYGFGGFVVSDWMDMERMYELHHTDSTMYSAYVNSVASGVDMHMHGPDFMDAIVKAVKDGLLPESRVDEACEAILRTKFKLGLFENPYCDEDSKAVFSEEHKASALKSAEESIVLLKNNGILPLDLHKFKKIFVTGPDADSQAILGDWALLQPDENVFTILEGIKSQVGDGRISYYDYGSDVRQEDMSKVRKAASMAGKADVAIVVVGENPLRYLDSRTSGENTDRMSISLIGAQEELVESIKAAGVPTIVVLVGGRPLGITWIDGNADAVVNAWEPGSLGGEAVAEVLTGKVNPSGKLPVTVPRNSGQVHMIYNHKPSQYLRKFVDGETSPLYDFGFGLSYSKFTISEPVVSKACISKDESFTVKVKIANESEVAGTDVVQLYIRDEYSSATRPVKELKDFSRVSLKPKETRTVEFTVTPEKLAYYDRDMHYGVEEGRFIIMVGDSSRDEDLRSVKVTVR
jgi:beta-glucosidase